MPEKPSVFVVDDEAIIASTLTLILNMSGFQATAFNSAEEAMPAMDSGCPYLLISDVIMPGMTGIDLAIRSRSACPNCKVLLFSGQAATNDLLESAALQGHNFRMLTKPVHPTELLAAIETL
jgi:DNA-binding NtrC family response regulator